MDQFGGRAGGSKGSKAPRKQHAKGEDDDSDESFTTIMLRNIPNKYTRTMLIDQLHSAGFKGDIDYLYLPTDFQNRCNVGYCFCNLRTPEARQRFQQQFDGVAAQQCLPGFNSYKVCQVTKAKWQGREENVRRLKSGPELMAQLAAHPEWLPLLLDAEGNPEVFDVDEIIDPNTMDMPRSQPTGGKASGRRQGKKGKGPVPMDFAWMAAYAEHAAPAEGGRGGKNSGGKRKGGKGGRGRGQHPNAGAGYPGMMMAVMTEEGYQYMPYDPYEGGFLLAPYGMEQQGYGVPYAGAYGAGYPYGFPGAYDLYGTAPDWARFSRGGKSGKQQMDESHHEALLQAMMEDGNDDDGDDDDEEVQKL